MIDWFLGARPASAPDEHWGIRLAGLSLTIPSPTDTGTPVFDLQTWRREIFANVTRRPTFLADPPPGRRLTEALNAPTRPAVVTTAEESRSGP